MYRLKSIILTVFTAILTDFSVFLTAFQNIRGTLIILDKNLCKDIGRINKRRYNCSALHAKREEQKILST